MRLGFRTTSGALLVTETVMCDISMAESMGVILVYLEGIHKNWFLNNMLTNRTITVISYDDTSSNSEYLAYMPEIYENAQTKTLCLRIEKGWVQ